MSFHTLVLTAGTSVLGPRNILGAKLREPNSPLTFPQFGQNPLPPSDGVDEETLIQQCEGFLSGITTADLNPQSVSAEFSLLEAVSVQNKNLAAGATIYLIHTPSFAGRLAVRLQKHLIEDAFHVHVKEIELPVPFDPSVRGLLSLASGAFMGVVSRCLEGHDPRHTAFAPIGGYKSMVALGHTAASFHGFSSLYLHEDSQVLQEISPVPVMLSPEIKAQLGPLARLINDGILFNELSLDQQRLIQQHPSFFTRADDLVGLNELGQFLRLHETPIYVHQKLRKANLLTPNVQERIRKFTDIALTNPDHNDLSHEKTLKAFAGKKLPWRLYKQGRESLRIVWQILPDGCFIYHIWTNHDDYDRQIDAGRVLVDPLPTDLSQYELL